MSKLDQELDASLRQIQKRRKTKLTLVVAGLVIGAGGMFALTSLMYSTSTDTVSPDRIGEESFM